MGTVIDLATFRAIRNIEQSTLSTPEEDDAPPKARPLTLRLNLLALKATRIFVYRPGAGAWTTASAKHLCIALKETFYTLTQPSPYMIRLITYESSANFIDMYFSKKFYTSPEAMPMLEALIDEVWSRGGYVPADLWLKINQVKDEQIKRQESHIDWESLHKNPLGDDQPPFNS